MKREDVVRLRKLLGVARGNISEWGGPYQTDDARSEILDALPALLALAEAVMDAPVGKVDCPAAADAVVVDQLEREAIPALVKRWVRLVAAPDGE